MLETLQEQDFRPRIGESFAAKPEEGEARELVLRAVDTFEGPPDGKRTPFSLLFTETEPDGHLPQQTVTLSHPEMGEFPLFIVPLGPKAEGMRYEAVFT